MIKRLTEIISRNERHPDYQRVVDAAILNRKLMTGEDMDSLMRQFDRRESLELFEQRKKITQHITMTVSQNVADVFYKIPRSNSVQRFIGYKDNNTTNLAAINSKMNKFWGKSSLDDYMNTRWIELNFIDPNTFVVLEWGNFDNSKERANPYPYEVYSENAIMYEYKDNVLQYLVSLQPKSEWVQDRNGTWAQKEKKIYTMYGINQTIIFAQVLDETKNATIKKQFGVNRDKVVSGNYFRENVNTDVYFEIVIPTAHNLGFVPAERIGVKQDMGTDGRTYVSPLHKGIPILMKMVKANSELDLTMALHAYPQKLQYMNRCGAIDCRDGKLLDGGICPACNGSGYEVITSAQEVITIALPKAKEDMLDLTGLVHYDYPPTELLKFQDEYVKSLTQQVKESVFNTEIFSKQQVQDTATGRNIALQNVYDALYPVANVYSKMWFFFVDTLAAITDLREGLIAFYTFSKDFKLKGLSELYMDLKAVGDAQASEFIKDSIENDIAGVIYSESERDLLKYKVKKNWYPFNGKTPAQIALITASSDLVPYDTKVFWANFSAIFDVIEMEQSRNGIDFYYLVREKQALLIQDKVKEIMAKIELTAIQEPQIDFTDE